jgi:hypothetical protein
LLCIHSLPIFSWLLQAFLLNIWDIRVRLFWWLWLLRRFTVSYCLTLIPLIFIDHPYFFRRLHVFHVFYFHLKGVCTNNGILRRYSVLIICLLFGIAPFRSRVSLNTRHVTACLIDLTTLNNRILRELVLAFVRVFFRYVCPWTSQYQTLSDTASLVHALNIELWLPRYFNLRLFIIVWYLFVMKWWPLRLLPACIRIFNLNFVYLIHVLVFNWISKLITILLWTCTDTKI